MCHKHSQVSNTSVSSTAMRRTRYQIHLGVNYSNVSKMQLQKHSVKDIPSKSPTMLFSSVFDHPFELVQAQPHTARTEYIESYCCIFLLKRITSPYTPKWFFLALLYSPFYTKLPHLSRFRFSFCTSRVDSTMFSRKVTTKSYALCSVFTRSMVGSTLQSVAGGHTEPIGVRHSTREPSCCQQSRRCVNSHKQSTTVRAARCAQTTGRWGRGGSGNRLYPPRVAPKKNCPRLQTVPL